MSNKPFLTAHWHTLVMLNYVVAPELIQHLVPAGTELDTWQGRHYVSMVGFRFEQTRVRGWAIPFHQHFDEVNLRMYVRKRDANGWRRGVVFVKEIVPRWAIATVARVVYNENYITLPMQSIAKTPTEDQKGEAKYRWKWNGHWCELGADFTGQPVLPAEGSEEQFITEHYWGYVTQRHGSVVEYEVKHPSWRIWKADRSWLNGELTGLYGPKLEEIVKQPAASAFIAEGSAISVSRAARLPSV